MRTVHYRLPSLLSRFGAALLGSLVSLSAAWAEEEKKLPHEWQYWDGRHYRLEADGNISCYSDGGRHPLCITGTAPPDPAKAKPLNCGSLMWEDGQRKKTTGYQLAGHWCNNAYANLYAKWESYKSLGQDYELATNPRGDVMCKSLDATTCLLGGHPAPHPHWPGPHLKPVVCGRALLMRESSTGYDKPDHWCNAPEIVFWDKDFDVQGGTHIRHIALAGWESTERPTWILRYIAPNRSTTDITLKLRGYDGRIYDDIPWSLEEDGIRYASIAKILRGVQISTIDRYLSEWQPARYDDDSKGTLAIRVSEQGDLEFVQTPGWPIDPFARKSRVMSESYLSYKETTRSTAKAWRYSEKGSPHNRIEVITQHHSGSSDGGHSWRNLPPTIELLMIRKRKIPPL